jgi:hypothetical protein
MKVTLAQKVRLWFAGACQLAGIILLMATPTPDGTHYIYTSNQNGYVYVGWGFVFLLAAVVLASISLYRFVKPRQEAPQLLQPQSAYLAPGPPSWSYPPPQQPSPQSAYLAPGPPSWPYPPPQQPSPQFGYPGTQP